MCSHGHQHHFWISVYLNLVHFNFLAVEIVQLFSVGGGIIHCCSGVWGELLLIRVPTFD